MTLVLIKLVQKTMRDPLPRRRLSSAARSTHARLLESELMSWVQSGDLYPAGSCP